MGIPLTDKNRLSILHPKLCEEWDFEKNFFAAKKILSIQQHLKRFLLEVIKCLGGFVKFVGTHG